MLLGWGPTSARGIRSRGALGRLLWMNLICVVPITLILFSVAPTQTLERFWRIFGLVAVVSNCNFVPLTLFNRLVWSRLRFRSPVLPYLLLCAGVLPLVGVVGALAAHAVFLVFGPPSAPEMRDLVQINVPLAVVFGLAYFLMGDYRYRLQTARSDLSESRRSHGELELERDELKLFALQVFLRPHFLFNALNTIAALIHEDPDKAEDALLRLARVLRRIVETRDESLVPLETEMAIVTDYLDLERIRLGDRLSVEIDVPEDVGAVHVPAMVVQPLVENAIQHGIRQRTDGGHIRIRAWTAGPSIRIEVVDDGPGVSSHHGTGKARRLLQDRLDALYGRRYEMSLMRDDQRGETIALLCFPLRTGAQAS